MEANHLSVVRKDYSYAKTLLDRIEAYMEDIGWYAAQERHNLAKAPENRIVLFSIDRDSAVEELVALLNQAKAEAATKRWFEELDTRIALHVPLGVRSVPITGALRGILIVEARTREPEQREEVLERCLEVVSLLHALRARLFDEALAARTSVDAFRDFAG